MFNSTRELDSRVGTMERGSINRSVSPTIMPEQEAYRPQAEHTAEQPQNRPTPEAGAARTRPENEVATNPRILALMQERDAAERRLQEAILDLETREQSPAFQNAKELFESGMRLKHINEYEADVYLFGHGDVISASSYPTEELNSYKYVTSYSEDQNEEGEPGNIYAALKIESSSDRDEVLRYFADLTEESSRK